MTILQEITAEAAAQRAAHPHDIGNDGHGLSSRYKWIVRLLDRLARSDDAGPAAYRAGMIGLGAMCCRAVEAFDDRTARAAAYAAGNNGCDGEDEESDASEPRPVHDAGPPSSRR